MVQRTILLPSLVYYTTFFAVWSILGRTFSAKTSTQIVLPTVFGPPSDVVYNLLGLPKNLIVVVLHTILLVPYIY
jgi:hypothetical protein